MEESSWIRFWVKIAVAGAIFGLISVLYVIFDIGEVFSLSEVQEWRDSLASYVDKYYVGTALLYLFSYIVVIALSIPAGAVLTILSGFLFGFFGGLLITLFGATTGAVVVFLLARYLIPELFRACLNKKAERIQQHIEQSGFHYLLFLRLIPLFPFFLVNVVPAFTRMKLRTYILATFIGIIPGSALFVYAGRELLSINEPSEVLEGGALVVLFLLGLFALVAPLYRLWRGNTYE